MVTVSRLSTNTTILGESPLLDIPKGQLLAGKFQLYLLQMVVVLFQGTTRLSLGMYLRCLNLAGNLSSIAQTYKTIQFTATILVN